jgi:hypothetical protein
MPSSSDYPDRIGEGMYVLLYNTLGGNYRYAARAARPPSRGKGARALKGGRREKEGILVKRKKQAWICRAKSPCCVQAVKIGTRRKRSKEK